MPGGLIRGYKKHLTVPHPGWQRTDPLDRGLIGEWRFDPATGMVLPDWIAGLHDGALDGAATPAWVTSQFGPALEFTGGEKKVTIPDDDRLEGFDTFTAESFIRYSTNTEDWGIIFGKRIFGAPWSLWSIGVDDTPDHLRFEMSDGAVQTGVTGTNALVDKTFYHVIATYDHVTVRLYVDGIETGVPAARVCTIGVNAEPVAIGYNTTNAFQWFEGLILLCRLYDRALSAAEVHARYELCLKRAQPMTHAWMMPWGMVTEIRIPRPPAAYNQLAIY